MEVSKITNNGVEASGGSVQPTQRAPSVRSDRVDLEGVAAIGRASQEVPEIRAEEVERGLALFNNVQYPPTEVINGLSQLIANHLKSAK